MLNIIFYLFKQNFMYLALHLHHRAGDAIPKTAQDTSLLQVGIADLSVTCFHYKLPWRSMEDIRQALIKHILFTFW